MENEVKVDRNINISNCEFERVKCPICQMDDSKIFESRDTLSIVQCKSCGLIYTNPRLTHKFRLMHFSTEYMASDKVISQSFSDKRRFTLKQNASIVKSFYSSGVMLDVGCGAGEFLVNFKNDSSWELYGIELSTYAASLLEGAFPVAVSTKELIENSYQESFFDVVTVLDTFIYISNPNEFLKEADRIIKSSGMLLIETPGFLFRILKNRGLISKILCGSWSHLNPNIQLYYYSKKTLEALAKNNNFKLVAEYPLAPSFYGDLPNKAFQWFSYLFVLGVYFVFFKKINLSSKVAYRFIKNA
jgi:SAM-dependent methyltransferase